MTKNEIRSEMKTLVENAKIIANALVKDYIGEPYKITAFGNDSLRIGFVSDRWDDGSDRYTDLDFYLGTKCFLDECNTIDDYRFEINPFTGGSFDPASDNYLATYFKLVGTVINSTKFCEAMKALMFELHQNYIPLRQQIWDIEAEERRIADAEAKAKREEEERILFEEQKSLIEKANHSDWVVINWTKSGKFIYRKKPVFVEVAPAQYDKIVEEYANLCRHHRYDTYKMIPVMKLKIAA